MFRTIHSFDCVGLDWGRGWSMECTYIQHSVVEKPKGRPQVLHDTHSPYLKLSFYLQFSVELCSMIHAQVFAIQTPSPESHPNVLAPFLRPIRGMKLEKIVLRLGELAHGQEELSQKNWHLEDDIVITVGCGGKLSLDGYWGSYRSRSEHSEQS